MGCLANPRLDCDGATPGGWIREKAYLQIREEILDGLEAAARSSLITDPTSSSRRCGDDVQRHYRFDAFSRTRGSAAERNTRLMRVV